MLRNALSCQQTNSFHTPARDSDEVLLFQAGHPCVRLSYVRLYFRFRMITEEISMDFNQT